MNKVAGWVWFPFRVIIRFILRNGKRIGVTIAGFVLLLAGLLMMVLPGPGLLFIILGFAVLATEYVWAERALNMAKSKAEQAKNKVLRRKGGSNSAATPPAPPAGSTPEPPG
jgi:uncharacterized protein (TIGR02611 family)